jgi:ATP-binding cassette subfamily B protein
VIVHRIWPILRPQRKLVLTAAGAIVGSTLITIAGPALAKIVIDHGIRERNLHVVNVVALVYLGLVLARPIFERAVVLCTARAGERFLGDLRVAAFEQLQRLSMPFFEEQRAGVLVSRLTADVQTLTTFTRLVLVEVVGAILLLVVTVVVLIVLSPLLSLVTLVALPPLVVSSLRYQRRSRPAYLSLRDRVADTLAHLQEGLTGVRVVQSFRRERDRFDDYSGHSQAQVGAWRDVALVNIGFFPVISLAQGVAMAAVLAAGGIMVDHGKATVGTVVAFTLYLLSLFDPIGRLGDWFSEFQSGRAALTKIVGLLDEPVTVPDGTRPLPEHGVLEARAVSFAYGDGPEVLHDVSLRIEPGEQLALVGPTGAGKSTLAKLLTRAYDPGAGSVSFGGVALREADASLRERIVFLPQEGHLFSGSIADNIRLGRADATDEQVRSALAAIGALERFEALPEGLDTDARTRGLRLSSGERQLVGIARVALAEPAVIVLDEATSSLDPATEAAVERALAAVSQGRTVITIAHRLSTAERADRVAVVEHGRITEIATHEALVEQGERYAELWASWQAGVAA